MEPQQKKRRPGRPRKKDRPITPEVLEEIGRLFLRGKSIAEIGRAIGVTRNAVDHHLTHTIKPLWRNGIQWDASIEIARAEEVIRLAMEGFDRSLRSAKKLREKYGLEEIRSTIKKKAPKAANKEKLVERTLERTKRDGDKGWLELVHLMMDFKAKVKGGYAPSQMRLGVTSELRVAGLTPPQLDELMLQRLEELRAERQRHQRIIETAAKNAGREN